MTHRKSRQSPLDLAMAALAAGSVAFAIYAMPDAAFGRVVELSGLPAVLPAAQPPLGTTARVAALVFAGIGTFALVWLVLRALGKTPAAPRRRAEIEEIEIAPPRLRRADAHPDAPSRRPIFAGLDLGEPLEAPREAEPEDDVLCLSEEEPDFASYEQEAWEEEDGQAEVFVHDSEEEPAQARTHPVEEPASIGHLMQRLELGLVRKEQDGDRSPAPYQAGHGAPNPIDERLRSAIHDLQKLAARS